MVQKVRKKDIRKDTELRVARAKLAILEIKNDPKEMKKVEQLLTC